MDFYDSVKEKLQGVIVSQATILALGLVRVVPILRDTLGRKLLILDTRNIDVDEQTKESLLSAPDFDGITMLGNFEIERVRPAAALLTGRIYFILEESESSLGRSYSTNAMITFAKEVGRCDCKGIIMTATVPGHITAVRKAIGKHPSILATHSRPERDLGRGIGAGADFEILTPAQWKRAI